MQDPTTAFQAMKAAQFPEQEQLKCPRCDSNNTKFCYYNNYNLSQPRYFCKNCRRYWTKGGALRNIPVGGGTRKNTAATKRSSNPKRPNPDPNPDPARPTRRISEPPSSSTPQQSAIRNSGDRLDPTRLYEQERKMLEMSGSFSSLLTSNPQFGSVFEGLNPNGSGLKMVQMGRFREGLKSGLGGGDPGLDVQGSGNNNNNNGSGNNSSGGGEGYMQGNGDWANSNGWPDLAIYTPSSTFQ